MAGVGCRVPGEAGRLGAGDGRHADARRDVDRRAGHHRLEGAPGRGVLRGSPEPCGCPGHYLGPAPVTAHLVGVAGRVGHLGHVGLAIAAAFAGPVPRSVTGAGPVPPVPESDTRAQPVTDADAFPQPVPVWDGEHVAIPDSVSVSVPVPIAVPNPDAVALRVLLSDG